MKHFGSKQNVGKLLGIKKNLKIYQTPSRHPLDILQTPTRYSPDISHIDPFLLVEFTRYRFFFLFFLEARASLKTSNSLIPSVIQKSGSHIFSKFFATPQYFTVLF